MQPCKKPLAGRISKYFFEKLVAMIARTKPVAMPDEEGFALDFLLDGLAVSRDAEFVFKITKHPHIMIAGKVVNKYATVAQFC